MNAVAEQFRIGELARRAGATPRAVRYYEELGLLPEGGRPRGQLPWRSGLSRRLRGN